MGERSKQANRRDGREVFNMPLRRGLVDDAIDVFIREGLQIRDRYGPWGKLEKHLCRCSRAGCGRHATGSCRVSICSVRGDEKPVAVPAAGRL